MIASFRRWLTSLSCQLQGGHWKVLHTDGWGTGAVQVSLRCVSCGHTSPGWEIGRRA